MATSYDNYLAKTKHRTGFRHRKMRVPRQDGAGSHMSAYDQGAFFEKNTFPRVGGGLPYVATGWTVVTGGTGDAQAEAATAGGGILITAPSDDDFDVTLTSVQAMTPAAGKVWSFLTRIQVSDADGIGFYVGFTTGGAAAALPFGTNYTDVVALRKAITDEEVLGHVRGNGGTAANTGTLVTMENATEIEVGFTCKIDADNAWGEWYHDGQITQFSAAQLVQLEALLTTPQSMYATVHVTGVTSTTPTLTVTSLLAQVDK